MELQLLIRRDDPSLDTIPVVNNRELSLAVAKQTIVTRTEELVSEEVIDIIFARLSKGEPGKSAYQAAVEAGYTLSEAEFNRDLATISELAGAVEDKVGKEEFNTLKEDVENITAEYKDQLDNLEQTLDGKVDKVDGKQLSTEDFTTEYKEQLDTLIENGGNGSDGELRELFNLMFEYDESLNAIQAKLPLYSLGSITAKGQGASSGSGGGGTAYNRLDNWNDYGEGKEGYVLSAYLGYSLREQFLSTINGFNTNIDSLISFKETFEKMFSLDTDNVIKAKLPLYSLGSITAKGKGVSSGSGGGGTAYDRLDNWSDYGEGKEGYVLSAYLGYSLYEQLLNKLDANGTAKDSEKLGGLYASNYVTNDGLSDLAHKTGTYEDLIAGGLVGYTLPTRAQNQTIALAAKGDIPQEISDLSDGETILSAIDGFNTNIDSLISFKETFEKMFSLDTDNVIKAKLPLYSLGSITAKGKGASSGSGGGGTAYDRLDKWSDYTSDKADYVLSAGLGWDLNTRISNKFDSANFTKANLKNTLGISDWALAATKPSYTAAEVGALSLDGTSKMQQSKNIVWSNTEGYEDIDVFSNGLRLLGYNASKGNYGGGIHIGTRYGWQLMTKWGENPLYYRFYDINSQIWRDWERLAFASDIPTNLSQLTDDVVAGKYLSLSGGTLSNAAWRSQLTIERSGSANDSVIAYSNSNGLLGCLGYRGADGIPCVWLGETGTGIPIIHANNIDSYNAGSANILQTPSNKYYVTANTRDDDWKVALKIGGWDSLDAGFATKYGTAVDIAGFNTWYHRLGFNVNGTIEHWMGINTTEMSRVGYLAYTTSNVASATKLETPRTLWGQRFDGTKNITLGLNLDGYKSTGTVSQISDLGDKGLVVSIDDKRNNYGMAFWVEGNGNGYIQQQAFSSSTTYSLCIQPFGGNVGIGTTSPTERLDVGGNIKASGNINATSITINGVTITASNGSITVNGNVLATGSITAKKSA